MTILVSIVSKQTIPNILFIKEKQAEVDKFVFINTEYTLQEKYGERIKTVCKIAEKDCINIKVVEDDVMNITAEIKSTFEEHHLSDDARFLVNITGGTKPMALGVYIFFEEKKSEFYYITFPKSNQYQRLYTDHAPEKIDLKYRIKLEDYLLAYGINIASKQTQLFKDVEYTKLLARSAGKKVKARIKEEIQLLKNQGDISPEAWNYFKNNGYFEEYIYTLVKTTFGLNDDQIGLGVKTVQPLVDGPEPDHEIDVMFVYENRLHIIECKTGVTSRDQYGNTKNIFEEAVFRLYAIKDRIGFSNGYIATLQVLREPNGELKPIYAKKAKPSRITVIDGKDIKQQEGLPNALQKIKG